MPDRETVLADVLAIARAQGCTCEAEVAIDGDLVPGAISHAHVMHDSWCPLLLARARMSN